MPVAGLISWATLAVASFLMGARLPLIAVFFVPAIPVPLALLIDILRGNTGLKPDNRHNPILQLFMTVAGLLFPSVILAARAAHDPALLVLGLAILAGMVWVPHGWGADDRAGFIHIILRTVLCYLAYLFTPPGLRVCAIAAATSLCHRRDEKAGRRHPRCRLGFLLLTSRGTTGQRPL
ncbi:MULTISPECIES: DUF7010 family protein [Asaia]|uniref:DUF7010 family protein n=1 Tax=Asaia TaxID=91914 RepID=UPI002FC37996